MYKAITRHLENADIIIKAAAPSDYKIQNASSQKIKDSSLTLRLEKNVDIAASIGKIKGSKRLVIFAAETEDLIKNARAKLKAKNADLIVANDVTKEGAGFGADTNIVTIITRDKTEAFDKMSKHEVADVILDFTVGLPN
jgi:phosphopantothenoylcysteine decarboxylase/phosphopantothenate--cysteine ligase